MAKLIERVGYDEELGWAKRVDEAVELGAGTGWAAHAGSV